MSAQKRAASQVVKLIASTFLGILMHAAVPSRLAAQAGASVWGLVKDTSGGVIAGATVKIKNLETGAERNTVTDEDGRFSAPSLAVGQYEIAAFKRGFRDGAKTRVTLVVGQREEVDLTLQVGDVHQTVEVSSYSTTVAVTNEDISGLVGQREVKDLPLNGRSYDQLLTLNPGIVNYASQRAGGIGTSNSVLGNMFAASEARA